MDTNANSRRVLHNELQQVLSTESAEFLMDSIPIAPYSQIALRDDVIASATLLRGEMQVMGAGLRGEMAELRTELRTELSGEMTELKTDLRGEMTELSSSLTNQMIAGFARVDRQFADAQFQTTMAIHQISTDMRRLFMMQMTLMAALFAVTFAMIGAG